MDQETVKDGPEIPKYLRGYKDPEKRKKYFRDRMREKYRAKKEAEGKVVRVHRSTEEVKEQATESALSKTLDIAKDLTPDGDDDPLLKVVNRYGKYLPLVIEGIKGFTEAARSYQQATNPQPQQQQQRGPVPPPGWLELPSMEKLKRKWEGGEISAWWRAGEAYDAAIAAGGGNVSSYPVAMEATHHGMQEAARQNYERAQARRGQQQAAPDNRSWADLQREAANFGPKTEGSAPMAEAPIVEKKGEHISPQQIAALQRGEISEVKPEQAEEVAQVTINAEEALQEVGAAMTEDVKRNLAIVVEYFKTRPLKQFEKDLAKAETYAKTWGPILNMTLGFHVKETIKRTSPEEILELLEQQDPKKAELIKKKKLEPQLRELWEKLKAEILKPTNN